MTQTPRPISWLCTLILPPADDCPSPPAQRHGHCRCLPCLLLPAQCHGHCCCLPCLPLPAAACETHVRTTQGPGKSLVINLVSNPLIQLLLDLISKKICSGHMALVPSAVSPWRHWQGQCHPCSFHCGPSPRAKPRRAVPQDSALWILASQAAMCHAVLCRATPCCAMPCRAVTCHSLVLPVLLAPWTQGHVPAVGTQAISQVMEQSAVGLQHTTG